jgi:uncharacterized surface protein with fasciclin (FAS1) repeats
VNRIKNNSIILLAGIVLLVVIGIGAVQMMQPKTNPTMDKTTTASPMQQEETKQTNTIVDIAAGNENFKTLVQAVTEAGLVETLKGEGPFTVLLRPMKHLLNFQKVP